MKRLFTKYQLTASVLPTVLVLSVIMMMIVWGAFMFWEKEIFRHTAYRYEQQQRIYLESALVLYCKDEFRAGNMLADSSYTLFPDKPGTTVTIKSMPWGLYEVVSAVMQDSNFSTVQLLGQISPAPIHPTFWMRNRRKSLSLAGDTEIEGKAYLPSNGVQYAQMQSLFFSGKMLSPSNIKESEEELPVLDEHTQRYVAELYERNEVPSPLPEHGLFNSFYQPTVYIGTEESLYGQSLQGNIVIYADRLNIAANDQLHDILIVANKVTIESGFKGNLQIFAKDSVIVAKKVILEYPSGIFMSGNHAGILLKVGEDSEINGYVALEVNGESKGRPHANYIQAQTAKVRGLLRVNGVAQLQGLVSGSAWLTESYYFAKEGYYSDILYNASIKENEDVCYPFLQQGDYGKEGVKWLY
jgi:hypothetical protein